MKLLALDTSSQACSVALQIGDSMYARHEEKAREHTRLLLPMIRSVLRDAVCTLKELDAIVLGNGPGSFIGMRIAASVAQGLAHGATLPIIPVSSLAAVATQVFSETNAEVVAVAQDAHMEQVYLGLFARSGNALPEALQAECLQSIETIEALPANCHAAGLGWQRYPELATLNADKLTMMPGAENPDARFLLPLAGNAARLAPAEVSPAYLRQKVAENPAKSAS